MSSMSNLLEEGANHLLEARSSIHAAIGSVGQVFPGLDGDLQELFTSTDDVLRRVIRLQSALEGGS